MRTSDLIDILASDVRPAPPGAVNRKLLTALAAGGLITFAIVALGLRCQPLLAAAQQPWFWMKAGYTGLLTVAGAVIVRRLSVPGSRLGAAPFAAALVILVMFALGIGQILSAAQAGRVAAKKADQSQMFGCIMVDPVTGRNRIVIENVWRLCGVLTLLALAGWIIAMFAKSHQENLASGGRLSTR